MGDPGLQRLEHVVLADVDLDGELGDGRRPPQLLGQVLLGPAQLEVQLLGPAGRAHRPGAIAEVALELALDRAAGEGRERHPHVGIEALDGVDDRHQRDLAQVVRSRHRVASSA